eukprot:CAMPEP_0170629692 /NCGR_PEP_ID=MMETSP0224-20130122/33506_1 /TAXON_ID=285029 /ORGANISM="Togula jolla, Strain CCCM 725" /LENGTH=144 /DNA_ID=CAMNT_0010957507 /DNA_START=124 /DNA_END=555 /DNA_ORIENTATION=-
MAVVGLSLPRCACTLIGRGKLCSASAAPRDLLRWAFPKVWAFMWLGTPFPAASGHRGPSGCGHAPLHCYKEEVYLHAVEAQVPQERQEGAVHLGDTTVHRAARPPDEEAALHQGLQEDAKSALLRAGAMRLLGLEFPVSPPAEG